jgi:hypothetical protein
LDNLLKNSISPKSLFSKVFLSVLEFTMDPFGDSATAKADNEDETEETEDHHQEVILVWRHRDLGKEHDKF